MGGGGAAPRNDRQRLGATGRQRGPHPTASSVPAEREELYQAREAFRRARVNLNGLLHAVHRFHSGALDQLPAAEEFRFMLDDIRTSAARYSDALKKLP